MTAPIRRTSAHQAAAAPSRLSDKHLAQTRELIVQAACDEVESHGLAALTNASIAARAGVSERTVYRHFETRQALMAAVAAEVARQLATPPVPADPHGLRQYPAALFGAFEKRSRLTREALHTELFEPVRDSVASERWRALRALLHEHWPAMPSERLDLAAVNLRYLLAATTWNYHRRHLGLDAEGSVAAVAHALACILDSLGPPGRRPAPKGAGRASRMP